MHNAFPKQYQIWGDGKKMPFLHIRTHSPVAPHKAYASYTAHKHPTEIRIQSIPTQFPPYPHSGYGKVPGHTADPMTAKTSLMWAPIGITSQPLTVCSLETTAVSPGRE